MNKLFLNNKKIVNNKKFVSFTTATLLTGLSFYSYNKFLSTNINNNNNDHNLLLTEEKKNGNILRVGVCQILVGTDKEKNLKHAQEAVRKAAKLGSDLICLPECFNSEYATTAFPKNAEKIPNESKLVNKTDHPSTHMLINIAKELNVYLIGGSIPELGEDNKVYNTSIIINPEGDIVTKHRKVHLFDIDIKDGITFKESDTLSAGNKVTSFDTKYGKIGVGICYDLRFPEYAMALRQEGCDIIVYPGVRTKIYF